jgi:ribosomal silencing factor RsfS
MHLTVIRPVVTSTFDSETWALIEKDEMRFRIFERQIYEKYKLEKIYGE